MSKPESPWKSDWDLRPDTTYLNHGSFGPSPRCVLETQQYWTAQLEQQPMDFYLRQLEPALAQTQDRLGEFVGTAGRNLVLVDNATFAMNIVAASVDLEAGDEVLLTDHEYGAVQRIWRHRCESTGAQLVTARMPWPPRDPDEMVEAVLSSVTDRTRLAVISHVTSATALVFPVHRICEELQERGIRVCVDGPHAIAMVPLELDRLRCDYYAASCHKWLSAAFGSGFLYVAPQQQQSLKPSLVSWGGSLSGQPSDWHDEYNWLGTRNPSALLSIPTALDYMESVGVDRFLAHSRQLLRHAAELLGSLPGVRPAVPVDSDWYRTMLTFKVDTVHWRMPERNQVDPLQTALWEQFRIEVPCPRFAGQRLLRVSCHLYNQLEDIERLYEALRYLLIDSHGLDFSEAAD